MKTRPPAVPPRFLVLLLPLWLALFPIQSPASPTDPAPLPDKLIDALVQRHGPQTSIVDSLDRQVEETLDALKTQSLDWRNHRDGFEQLRRQVANEFANTRKHFTGKGSKKGLRDLDARKNAILARMDGVIQDLKTLDEPGSEAEREPARQRLAETLQQHRQRRAADALPAMPETPVPGFELREPGPPDEPKPSLKLPMYQLSQREQANGFFAFAGDPLLLAAAGAIPASAASCGYTAADLADDGLDVTLTADIRVLAQQLNYSPIAILSYVANNIAYEPYFGALKGAAGTLKAQAGGASDKSSLLIALLRASNIPARYVQGVIQFNESGVSEPNSRDARWLGTKTHVAAAARLAANFNPAATALVDASNNPAGIKASHVWVEACVPYAHYRGTGTDTAGARWVPLDPTFETRNYQPGIVQNTPFYANLQTYLQQSGYPLPLDFYAEQLVAPALPQDNNTSLEDVPYAGAKIPQQFDILPASLPYDVVNFTNWSNSVAPDTSVLPDSHRYQLAVTVKDGASPSPNILYQSPGNSLPLPKIALQRLTLSFRGATPADQTALSAWQTDNNTASSLPCTIYVVPNLLLNGIPVVGTGSGNVDICTTNNQLSLTLTLAEARGAPANINQAAYTNIVAGNYHALEAYAFQASDQFIKEQTAQLTATVDASANPNQNLDATLGEFLHVVGLKYMRHATDAVHTAGGLLGQTGDSGNHLGIAASQTKVDSVFSLPFGLSRNGFYIDMPGMITRERDLSTGAFNLDAFLLAGYASSAYESYVWQENARLDAVSTVLGMQYAKQAGIGVATINASNSTSQLPQLHQLPGSTDPLAYSTADIQAITNYINQGFEITLPLSRIQYQNWNGTVLSGWLSTTVNGSTTYKATFPIQGGYAGGYTVGAPINWSTSNNTATNTTTGLSLPNFAMNLTGGTPSLANTNLAPSGLGNGAVGSGATPYNTFGDNPVSLATGNFFHTERDLTIPYRDLPFVFERSYNSSLASVNGPLGYGWTHSLNHRLIFLDDHPDGLTLPDDTDGITSSVAWIDGTGSDKRIVIGGATSAGTPANATFTVPSGFYFQLAKQADGSYKLTEPNGLGYSFAASAGTINQISQLARITSRNGNNLGLSYVAGKLDRVTDDTGRFLQFGYDANGYLNQLSDWTNRAFQYQVNASGDLVQYANPLAAAGKQKPISYAYYTTADGPQLAHLLKNLTLPKGNSLSLSYYVNGRVASQTDSTGATTSFRYNDFQRETVTVDANGHTLSSRFDANGNPVKIVDENGGITRYSYDPSNPYHRVQETNAEGLITQYTYLPNSNDLAILTQPSGKTLNFGAYNGFHQPGWSQDANGNYTVLKYDANGNLTDRIALATAVAPPNLANASAFLPTANQVLGWSQQGYDGHGNHTGQKLIGNVAAMSGPALAWTYDTSGLYPTGVTRTGNRNGQAVTDTATLVYDSLGRMTQGVRANFEQVAYGYDMLDHVVSATDAVGQARDAFYDDNGNPVENRLVVTDPATRTPTQVDSLVTDYDAADRKSRELDAGGNATRYGYDGLGHVTAVTDADGYTLTYGYDAAGRLIGSTDAQGHASQRGLDAIGRMRSLTDANRNTSTYTYWDKTRNGRLKQRCDGENHCTGYDYDGNGNVTAITDGAGNTTLVSYDALNRPLRIVQPVYTDPTHGPVRPVSRYQYDLLGNRIEVDSGFSTDSTGANLLADQVSIQMSTVFDDFHEPIAETDPLNRTWQSIYDLHGNLTEIRDPLGHRIVSQYGYGGQLLQQQAYNAVTDTTPAHTVSYTRNVLGQVTSLASPEIDYAYGYDNAHRLVSVQEQRPGNVLPSKSLSYQWSPGGLLNHMIDQDGRRTDYEYDPAGRIRFVWAPDGGQIGYAFDDGGRLADLTLPGGLSTHYSYYRDDRLHTLTTQGPEGTLQDHSYTYDADGNLATHNETIGGIAKAYGYSYDSLNRLTQVSDGGAISQSYTYDSFGNRVGFQNGTAQYNYTYDAAQQIKARYSGSLTPGQGALQSSYQFDANGNLTQITGAGALTLGYDLLNRTVSAQAGTNPVEQYRYDPEGRRIQKTVAGSPTLYHYDGSAIYAEFTGATPVARYTHGAGIDTPQVRAQVNADQTVTSRYYVQDGRGSVVAMAGDPGTRSNAALAAKGSSAKLTAGGTYSGGYALSAVNDGELSGANPTAGGLWLGISGSLVEIDFAASQTIDGIDVFTGQTVYTHPETPQPGLTVTSNVDTKGILAEYWTGSAWAAIPGASISSNNKVWVKFNFPALSTAGIRLTLTDTDNVVSVAEVQAWTLPQGGAATTQRFDAFGNLIAQSGTIPTYGYTGREPDSTGLTYYRARYYDPTVGRFTQADPLGFVAGVNRYVYTLNSPVNFTDPSGLDPTFYFPPIPISEEPLPSYSTNPFSIPNGGTEADKLAAGVVLKALQWSLEWAGPLVREKVAPYVNSGSTYATEAAKTAAARIRQAVQTGKIGEKALEILGGEPQKRFVTSNGLIRYVDRFVNGVAHEAKVGYTRLTKFVAAQIEKDMQLILDNKIRSATWHFFRSPVTGKGGPSPSLKAALDEAGIQIEYDTPKIIHK